MDKIKLVESKYIKKDIPKFKVGDVIKVYVKIAEQEKTRTQVFEGVVIGKRGSGLKQTFTVRRISYGEGVERTFLLHSPYVEKTEVVKTGKVTRAKLYYLRDKIGKKGKIAEERGKESSPANPASSLDQEAETVS